MVPLHVGGFICDIRFGQVTHLGLRVEVRFATSEQKHQSHCIDPQTLISTDHENGHVPLRAALQPGSQGLR